MFLPDMPLWCWSLLGEDTVRLSQPTYSQVGMQTRYLPQSTLVARCQYVYTVIDPADEVSSFPFLCGHVALLLAHGARLCRLHSAYYRLGCAWCEEYTPVGKTAPAPAAMPCGER